MALIDTYSQIGDAIRHQYGTNDKYSLEDMSKMIGGLEIHNYLDEGQTFNSDDYDSNNQSKTLTGISMDTWNTLIGKTITVSYDLEYSGYQYDKNVTNRVTAEWGLYTDYSSPMWTGAEFWPKDSSGKFHVSHSIYLPDKKIISISEGCFFNLLNHEAKVKAYNFKLVVNPMGGVIPVNLFADHLKYEPQFAKQEGTLYTVNITSINPPYASFIFNNGVVLSKPNQAYKLKFKARGTGSFWTYEYGNNYQGTYVDNGHEWNLTDQWQDYEQLFPIESVPIKHYDNGFKDGFLVDIRTMKPLQGEIADIEFIPID